MQNDRVERERGNMEIIHIHDSWNYQEMNFKIFITSILKILMNKLNCLQEQMGSVSRKMEILRKNKN